MGVDDYQGRRSGIHSVARDLEHTQEALGVSWGRDSVVVAHLAWRPYPEGGEGGGHHEESRAARLASSRSSSERSKSKTQSTGMAARP